MPRTGKRGKYKLRPLTEKQISIFNYLVDYITQNEFPPSIREIGDAAEIASTSVVNYNLNKLEEHGLISRWKEVSRAIKINKPKALEFGLYAGDMAEDKILQVPVLGNIVASNPVNVGEVHTWQASDEWIGVSPEFISDTRYVYALRVQGDSMSDASILDNDIVLMGPARIVRNGDMVSAWLKDDDEVTLKRFYMEGDNIRLQPCSPDPQYQPIIRPADKVDIQGKVLGVIRTLS